MRGEEIWERDADQSWVLPNPRDWSIKEKMHQKRKMHQEKMRMSRRAQVSPPEKLSSSRIQAETLRRHWRVPELSKLTKSPLVLVYLVPLKSQGTSWHTQNRF